MNNWKEMLLDIPEVDYLAWVKWLDEIWVNRDSKRLKDLPITLKETQTWYAYEGKVRTNEYSEKDGKVPRETKVGVTLGKWAFVYDRPVAELEKQVFLSVIGEFVRENLKDSVKFSEEIVKSLEIDDNDCVICNEKVKHLLPRVDYILETKVESNHVIIIKGLKGLEVEWSFRPTFTYGPKDCTLNEYRYVLSREKVDPTKYECIITHSL